MSEESTDFDALSNEDLEARIAELETQKSELRNIEKPTGEDIDLARSVVAEKAEIQKTLDGRTEFASLLAEDEAPETEEATEVAAEEAGVSEADDAEAEITEAQNEETEVADTEAVEAEVVETEEADTEAVEAEVEVEEASTETEEVAEETEVVETEVAEAEVEAEVTETEAEEAEVAAEAVEAEVVEAEVATEEASAEAEVVETEEASIENIEEAEEAATEIPEEEATAEASTETDESNQESEEMSDTPVEGALENDVPNIGGLASPVAESNVMATSGAYTKGSGEAFESLGEVANEITAQFRHGGGDKRWSNVGRGGVSETVNFLSIAHDELELPQLSTISEEQNYNAMQSAVTQAKSDRDALGDNGILVASGGICAPFNTDYSFCRVSEVQSPFESCLPRVAAPRGGIKYLLTPDFKHARQGITQVTCHEDANGYESTPEECLDPENPDAGTTPDKPCVCVPCPEVAECCVTAVPWCVRWGNFNYYTFPELVENFMQDMMIAYAAEKEVAYLDAVMGASTVVDATGTLGAPYAITEQIRRAAANYRRRNHMNPNARLQLVAPSWLMDVFGAELAMRHDGPACASEGEIRDFFRCAGVDVCFYYHTPSVLPEGVDSQAFDQDQVAGPLNDWPNKAVTFLYAPGTFVRLDGGSLDFGIVRDSSLIATNDFIMAAEQFIGVCEVCPGGSLALVHDIAVGCGGVGENNNICVPQA